MTHPERDHGDQAPLMGPWGEPNPAEWRDPDMDQTMPELAQLVAGALVSVAVPRGGAVGEADPARVTAGQLRPAEGIDHDTVRRAAAGDDGAFAHLVEAYDPLLRELAFHLLGDRSGMDAVLRSAYIKAYRGLPRLERGAEPGPWLYRIAYLACLDELRKRHRRPRRRNAASGAGAPAEAEPPLTIDPPASAFDLVFTALPVDQRATVLMVDRAGFGIDPVAHVLDRPVPVALKALRRARAVLHAALAVDAPAETVETTPLHDDAVQPALLNGSDGLAFRPRRP